jgi:hypothetical protein
MFVNVLIKGLSCLDGTRHVIKEMVFINSSNIIIIKMELKLHFCRLVQHPRHLLVDDSEMQYFYT